MNVTVLQDDWDVSDSEKKKPSTSGTSTPAVALKKKRNLKTVLAEKEARLVSSQGRLEPSR